MTKKKENGPRKDATSTVDNDSSTETSTSKKKTSSAEMTSEMEKISSTEMVGKKPSVDTVPVKTNGENGGEFDGKARKETLAILSIGCGLETAANYVGIPMGRIRKEIRRNSDFARDVRRAEERAEIFFLTQIKKAAEKEQYWRAAAWALERKAPNRYAARGAETMTIDDIREIFRKLAEIVLAEVSASDDRKRVAVKIRRLLTDLTAVHENGRRKRKKTNQCNTDESMLDGERTETIPRNSKGMDSTDEGKKDEFSSETFPENETIDFEEE